jgi:uncharacterized protein YbjT (DUF2867 family)
MQVTVVGGTGLIGARVIKLLRDHGDEVRVASRRTGVNAYSGEGLREAFEGVDVVVDVLNVNRPSYEYEQGLNFFDTCTRSVLRAEESAGVQHHVGLSVIGAERLDSNYFRGKVAQERLVAQSPIPHSVLRTTLFYENIPKLVDHVATTHMVRIPPVRVRPVAADDVAAALCRLARGVPLNGSFELAGPEDWFLDELAHEVLRAAHDPRRVVPDTNALFLGARLKSGDESLLPAWQQTSRSFTEWHSEASAGSARSPRSLALRNR